MVLLNILTIVGATSETLGSARKNKFKFISSLIFGFQDLLLRPGPLPIQSNNSELVSENNANVTSQLT